MSDAFAWRDFRLFQLISPSLPVGGFTYSQGLEWAVESGWVTDADHLQSWLQDMLQHSVATLELPVMQRLYEAFQAVDTDALQHWNEWLYANRETSELRSEERQRGQALVRLLRQLEPELDEALLELAAANQLAGFALAGSHWQIDVDDLCRGYLWSWLENLTMAGVKLIPLGQSAGQKILLQLSETLPAVLAESKSLDDRQIGSFTPAQVIASSRHETQYTRLFRS